MQFGDFVGNAALKSALSGAFSRRRLPHAILLAGEAGLGKRTLARQVARAVVCAAAHREAVPCGVCPACIRSAAGSHPDIRAITGSGASNSISAESVEQVISDAYKRPEEADARVYLFLSRTGSRTRRRTSSKAHRRTAARRDFYLSRPVGGSLLPTTACVQTFAVHAPSEREAAAYVVQKNRRFRTGGAALAALQPRQHRPHVIGRRNGRGQRRRSSRRTWRWP